jgi:hypothetical protein
MPPDELSRSTLGLSAIAGGAVWGLYHLATTLLAGQPVHRQDILLAAFNVAAAVLMGGGRGLFPGPGADADCADRRPARPARLGFGIGAVAWEAAPFLYRWVRVIAARKAEGGAP